MSKIELPVIAIVKEAYALFFGELIGLLRAAWAPVILVVVLTAFASQVMGATDPIGIGIGAVLLMAGGFISILAIVRWHRFVILGETERDRPILAIRREEWMSALGYIVMTILPVVIFLPLFATVAFIVMVWSSPGETAAAIANSLVVIAVALSLAVVLFVSLRLSLILPHAAITGRLDFHAIFQATRFHSWRMLAIYLLVMLPLMLLAIIPELLATITADVDEPVRVSALSAWLHAAITVLFQLMMTIGLSLVYIRLVDLPRAAARINP